MSEVHLVLRVTLHAPAFHGVPDWPPSPARVFQALVAGAARHLDDGAMAGALEWLERQPPPLVAAPRGKLGQTVTMYVPNNDLDAKGGDPAKLPELRVAKQVRVRHLDSPDILYVWTDVDAEAAGAVVPLSEHLYQLGRGVDMAFAQAQLMDAEELTALLASWPGTIHRPSPGAAGAALACPRPGTLASLRSRHLAFQHRFGRVGKGRGATDVFAQPPRPYFAQVPYDAAVHRALFEIRRIADAGRFAASPMADVVALTTAWRDAAVKRLLEAGLVPDDVESVLVGRRPADRDRGPAGPRARIIPLPSVGHEHVDQGVRRLLVEVPAGAALAFEDVRWAFSGLMLDQSILVEGRDTSMLDRHYGAQATTFVSVTPLALPVSRRRIEPSRQREEAKGSDERAREEAAAIHAVRQALRHADVRTPPAEIAVQREPWDPRGTRAEECASLPRFPKERLWHVRIRFQGVERGPLLLGDGRFLGLGLMRPAQDTEPDLFVFEVKGGLVGPIDPHALARHLRRAVMARVQEEFGPKLALPKWVTGHQADGRPVQGHEHLVFMVDPPRERLLIARPPFKGRGQRQGVIALVKALAGFTELRAAEMGVLSLSAVAPASGDPLLAQSRVWRSVTPYRLERHRRADSAHDAARQDIEASLRRLGHGPAAVDIGSVVPVDGGVEARHVTLRFEHPVTGPLALGRTRHLGGGLFEAVDSGAHE